MLKSRITGPSFINGIQGVKTATQFRVAFCFTNGIFLTGKEAFQCLILQYERSHNKQDSEQWIDNNRS